MWTCSVKGTGLKSSPLLEYDVVPVEVIQLRLRLHSFRHNADGELARQTQHAVKDPGGALMLIDPAHKAMVNLDVVNMQIVQIREP